MKDDRELTTLLSGLTPRRAPAAMDERVLAGCDAAARRAARARRRRRLALLACGAAAAAVAALWIGTSGLRAPDRPARPDRAERAVPRAASDASAAEEILAARAALLELRVARLREEAGATDSGSDYVEDLERLASELDTLERVYLRTAPVTTRAEPTPDKNDEETNHENDRQSYRPLPVDPRRGGARAG